MCTNIATNNIRSTYTHERMRKEIYAENEFHSKAKHNNKPTRQIEEVQQWKRANERRREKTTEKKSCENGSARINKGLKNIDCDCEPKRIKARLQIKNKN